MRYCGELQKIIGDVEGKLVTAADIWPFLRALHVLSLDLHSSTRQTEAHIRSMLAFTATDGDPVASAGASWNELIVEASTAMVASRSLRRDDLPAAMLGRHGVIGTNERACSRRLAITPSLSCAQYARRSGAIFICNARDSCRNSSTRSRTLRSCS